MILSYMTILNLGLGNSINIYIIQYKGNLSKIRDYIASTFCASLILIFCLIIFGIIFILFPHIFSKYPIGTLFYPLILIGILQYVNLIYSNIFRARNHLFEVAFNQSIIPLVLFLNVLFVKADRLLAFLVYGYLFANILSCCLYYSRSKDLRGGRVRLQYIKRILKKGIFLFLYNSAYYLILTITSTFVSKFYPIEQYGIYSFSYNLGHSILLLLEAFAFIIFPKVVDKLYSGDLLVAEKTLNSIRSNYICLAHGLMYIAIALFPFLIRLFPKFNNSVLMLDLMSLAIILSTISFGYNTLLIARNKEKLSAAISCISLGINICLGIILIAWLRLPYYLSVLMIMGSYLCFALLCSFFAHKMLYSDTKGFIKDVFPWNLSIPYILALILCTISTQNFCWVPLVLFIVLNRKIILEIYSTICIILRRPQIVDINN